MTKIQQWILFELAVTAAAFLWILKELGAIEGDPRAWFLILLVALGFRATLLYRASGLGANN